jgi:predicted  nucleic acid-binding Zn-ribbon protein
MNEKFIMDKLNDHDKRIVDLEKSQVKAETLLDQFIKTSNELSGTMKDVSKTMTEMQNSLTNNSKEICEINKKMDSLNNKVDAESNKSKIDIRDISREGITKILTNIGKAGIGVSAIYGIYELIK